MLEYHGGHIKCPLTTHCALTVTSLFCILHAYLYLITEVTMTSSLVVLTLVNYICSPLNIVI